MLNFGISPLFEISLLKDSSVPTGTSFKVKDKIYTYVDGSDSTEIYNYLLGKVGSAPSDNHKYKMIISNDYSQVYLLIALILNLSLT